MPSQIVSSLVEAARAAPSADNSQPFRYLWDGHKLTISYDTERVGGVTFGPREVATLLSAGAVIENMDQRLQAWHVDRPWDLSPLHQDEASILATLDLSDVAATPPGTEELSLFARHTNRLPFMKKPIPADELKPLEAQVQGHARIIVVPDAKTRKSVAGLVHAASEIRFQTREVHEWLGRSLRFTPREVARGDGLDVATLHLPPGGRSFLKVISDWKWMARLNTIGAYKLLATMESQPIADAPALIGIAGRSTPEDIIDAGRLMERVWIRANAQGIAVHPYYVISDQLDRYAQGKVAHVLSKKAGLLKGQVQEVFGLPTGETLHMLLRIGYPKHQALRSRRIEIGQCFESDS